MAATAAVKSRPKVGMRTFLPYLAGQWPALVLTAVLSLTTAGSVLLQPLLIRMVLDRVGTGAPVAGIAVLLVVLLFIAATMLGVRNFLLQRAAERLVLNARRTLAGHLLRLPIVEYDRRRTGDLLSRVGADTTLLRSMVTSGLVELTTGVLVVAGAATMMILLDPLMFGVTLLAMLSMLGAVVVARRVRAVSEQAQRRIGEMTATVERAISAARTIRAARAEQREIDAVGVSAEAAYRAGVRMARLQSMVGPTVTVSVQGAFLAVLGIGGARVAAGALTVGDLVAFVLFLFLMMMPIGQAMSAYAQIQAGLGALQRVEDMLAVPEEAAQDPPATLVEPAPAAPAVVFDKVSFSYQDGPAVLERVSFSVPYHSRTALVGPSGAGKTTILALVERFYDAIEGSVEVGGIDVRDQPRHQLRAQLGYVEQEAPVLAGTIRDNLLLAASGASDDELLRVLAAVNLSDLVHRTPEGLDAEVGEAGVLLSGGERQRLAIARTLLAAPPILLLDEPTSNLDSRNEQALREAIRTAADNRTMLIVAHRLSTVVDADQIIVLDRGRIVAAGKHHELTETSPLYRELAAHQLLIT